MAIALVSSVQGTPGQNGNTSSAIDTTGATLLVGCMTGYGIPDSISDSKGNTWTGLTNLSAGGIITRLWYVANPTVGSGHTFTSAGGNLYQAMHTAAFSGVLTVSPFDQENGSGAAAATKQPGSITPSEDNELIVTGFGLDSPGGGDATINGGFTIAQQTQYTVATAAGCALAYLIQTSAAAANPTWTAPSSTNLNAVIASFKATPGGGGGSSIVPILNTRRFYGA